jgi:hypothetical protein
MRKHGDTTKEQHMRIHQAAVPVAAASFLCLVLFFSLWTAAAGAAESSFILTEQALDDLRKEGLPAEILKKLEPLRGKKFATEDEFLAAVRQELWDDQTAVHDKQILQHAADSSFKGKNIDDMQKTLDQLEQRVKELESQQAAQEYATRTIIRDTLSKQGSKINEAVSLGGTIEVTGGWTENFSGRNEGLLWLSSAKLDLEIEANTWTRGSLIFDFDDGTNETFTTTSGVQKGIERFTVDQAFFVIGDTQKVPPYMTVGRFVLPFGISTGNPVTDTLTLEDPLTIEAFETRRTGVGIGLAFPTPAVTPAALPFTPPPVRPLVINPLISSLSKALGYKFSPPQPLAPVTPRPAPPRFNVGIYTYNGETFKGSKSGGYRPGNYINATAGVRLRGTCGRPYDQLRGTAFCPWSIDIDVDYISSVFESRFLSSEYQSFLGEIGFVKGMASSVKAVLGPLSLVGEWNGALEPAMLTDSTGRLFRITPSAWQVSLGYQFDWNPWVEEIGAQGNYLAIGYSESSDLEGGMRKRAGTPRAGSLPRRRLLLGAGEWILDTLRFSIEYSRTWDYPKDKGRTGKTADGILSQLTLVW